MQESTVFIDDIAKVTKSGVKPPQSKRLNKPASQLIKHYFIHVTPSPLFARLEGFDDRMLAGVKMLGCMPIR